MKISKSAGYALRAAVEMASTDAPVSVAEVAARHGWPPGALAKIFQALVRAGVAQGTRGQGGGYRLVRPAASISALEVIELFDGPRRRNSPSDRAIASDRLQQLLAELDETMRATFASVTVETLAH